MINNISLVVYFPKSLTLLTPETLAGEDEVPFVITDAKIANSLVIIAAAANSPTLTVVT